MPEIPLADAISSLRGELEEAIDNAKDATLRFGLNEIRLELTVAVTASGGGEAKVGLWHVLTLGAKADYSQATTHKLMLTLTPHLAGTPADAGIDVASREPEPSQ